VKTLVRLLSFARPYKGMLLLTSLSLVGASVFALITPKIIGNALDSAIKAQQTDTVQWKSLALAAVLVMIVAVFRGLFAYAQQYIGEKLSQSVAYSIRNAMYEQLQRLSFAYHDKAQIGQIMSRATQDVEAVRMYINMGLVRLVYIVILLLVTFALMAEASVKLALISWAFLPAIAIVSCLMSARLRPLWTLVQDGMGRMGNVLQENLSGVRVVKAFSREDFESEKFHLEAEALFEHSYKQNQIQALNTPLLTALGALSLVATVWYGGFLIDRGELSPGDLLAFLAYLYILQQPARMLGFITNVLSRTISAGNRIYEILDAENAVKDKPGAVVLPRTTGHVTFENVAFGYDRLAPVLSKINVEAQPGQVIALVGPTGSGKSTIVNLMPRFYDVTEGAIKIDGHDIRDVTLESLRRNIGIVQQDMFLFINTIRENIRYGRLDATDEDVEEAAKAARIHDFILSLPDGYDTWVGERGVTLSGGQKQRVSIARTLIMDPAILIFDDSTSSVDMETEYLIQQALTELMRGRTTFVIAQRLRTVKDADQILVLDRGLIVERGRHEELLTREGLYRQIYELELKDQDEAFQQARAAAQPPGSISAVAGG
jgi:ABC-type multidrug transport system fused ATPase/permease subunit